MTVATMLTFLVLTAANVLTTVHLRDTNRRIDITNRRLDAIAASMRKATQ